MNMWNHHHHHHVMLVARISLTLSRHFSLSFIASGRSSGQHPLSSHSCWMYVRAGRPAFARPCVGVHKSTSLMSSSLLLQQCRIYIYFITLSLPIWSGWELFSNAEKSSAQLSRLYPPPFYKGLKKLKRSAKCVELKGWIWGIITYTFHLFRHTLFLGWAWAYSAPLVLARIYEIVFRYKYKKKSYDTITTESLSAKERVFLICWYKHGLLWFKSKS